MFAYVNGELKELTPEEEKEYLDFVESIPQETYEAKIVRQIRKKYSVDDELAILRQRDSKPEEFKEYFDYVEAIKDELKNS